MKRFFLFFAFAALMATGCKPEARVMARAVPERADDFVFENNLIAGRFYGEALEGNPTSPGLDIWVKMPGKLVADKWYKGAQKDPEYYHHNHDGKDCYKVAVSLGGGASAPFINGRLCYPSTNYRASSVEYHGPDTVVFTLSYPQWEADSAILVSLEKKVTVAADSYFIDVEDVYTFSGVPALIIAAGYTRHQNLGTIEVEHNMTDRLAIWEAASDQGVEKEDGKLGVAVVMPEAQMRIFPTDRSHSLLLKAVGSGESVRYKVGSCWSKGDVKRATDWFKIVDEQ